MNKHVGSTLDSLFDELGEREEVEILTQKKLRAIDGEILGVGKMNRDLDLGANRQGALRPEE